MSKSTISVTCSKCGHVQTVKRDAVSIFCPKCQTRVEIESLSHKNKALKSLFSRPGSTPHSVRTVKVECPHCGSKNAVPRDAVSAFCTHCKKRISLKTEKSPRADFAKESKITGGMRTVKCFYCGGVQEVSAEAYSTSCSGCGRRIHVKDLEIKGHQLQDIFSGGRIFIRKGSLVQANIKAADVEVSGEVKGDIYAENTLLLRPGAKVVGKVTTKNFVMLEGAMLTGSVNAKAVKRHPKAGASELSAVG